MMTLGIELSSRQGSVALLKGDRLLAEKTWIGERVRHNVLFQTLNTLLEEAGALYSDISLYAVGRGPGSFSGMRMSFAVAQALALPNKAEVRAVSSGAALALAVSRETKAKHIAVIGDARRDQFWFGQFDVETISSPHFHLVGDWKLIPHNELVLAEDTHLVSPEAERLTSFFPNIGPARFPLASDVAKLVLLQAMTEPLEPLYLHPPVFIEPKYH
ncbi:MAG: tRNA (adenosine(37)-N6)-threonylcarbamoyltransferase complex dimerization subunit type 1 TsaB [Kiritimatiellaceae bacterium]|nr:tRNA (adenosine(37)-N6)-threonylcarbamoyltransferase complex dimerization subunit type 1 TsaB [Kiritimatiellaceae bacterium]